MVRSAAIAFAVVLPLAALAQTGGGVVKPQTSRLAPLSRAQVAQMIEDRGYFEIDDLKRQADGGWRCTALVAAGRRVTVVVSADGAVSEAGPPGRADR